MLPPSNTGLGSQRQDLRLEDSSRRILYSGNLKRKPDDKDYEVILLDHLLVLARPTRKNKYDEQMFEICHDVRDAGVRTSALSAVRAVC